VESRWTVISLRSFTHITKILSCPWGHDPWGTCLDMGQSVFRGNPQHCMTCMIPRGMVDHQFSHEIFSLKEFTR
jgi:hypothetical protein